MVAHKEQVTHDTRKTFVHLHSAGVTHTGEQTRDKQGRDIQTSFSDWSKLGETSKCLTECSSAGAGSLCPLEE